MTRLGLDARKLGDGGIGTYIRGLLGALASDPGDLQLVALVAPQAVGRTPWPGAVREIPVSAGNYSLAEHFVVPHAARRAGIEMLHAPHYTLPLGWNGPSVVTIHDLIHVRFARFFPPGASVYARAMAGLAARRADAVITDSLHVRDDVVELLGVSPEKVHPIALGVSSALAPRTPEAVAAFRNARSLPADYVLHVGARKPHKNLGLLLEALALQPAGARPPLVLSGVAWSPHDRLAMRAFRLGMDHHVHFAGSLDTEDDLALLYSGAALYAQPSLSEGFGLPPLEAMACGTPVVSSNGGSLPEAVGDAALVLPPQGPERWAEAISALLADPARRAVMATTGMERARTFTWARTAEQTRAVYAEALASARSRRGTRAAASAR